MAEPTVAQLVATTIQNYHKQFADNVSLHAVTALLRGAPSTSSRWPRRPPC
jgi:hypothetical protein